MAEFCIRLQCDTGDADGVVAGMTEGTPQFVTELTENGHTVRTIGDVSEMQTWKSVWPYIFNLGPCDEGFCPCITAIRLHCRNVSVYRGGSLRAGRGQSLNHIDTETGRLFVSPTTHEKTGIHSVTKCLEIATLTRERKTLFRVCIVEEEDEGVLSGHDLGWYVVEKIDLRNFIHIRPASETECNETAPPYPPPLTSDSVIGRKVVYKGMCFESEGEARFAVLCDYLNTPYQYEKREHEIYLGNSFLSSKMYRVDFVLWPGDVTKTCYVEWKMYHPTLEEQTKMKALVRETGYPGYIAWGEEYRQSIRWSSNGKQDRSETKGVRLMKFAPQLDRGGRAVRVRRVEGYYMAANDHAVGKMWACADADHAPEESHRIVADAALSSCMAAEDGTVTLSRSVWKRFGLCGKIRKRTRIVTADGKMVYTPRDGTSLMFRRNPMHRDCTSLEMLRAFDHARSFQFS